MFFLGRLKVLISKESEYQKIKEKRAEREVSALKDELIKLKRLALLVVKEQQRISELLEGQNFSIKQLTTIADQIPKDLSGAPSSAEREQFGSQDLETGHQVSIFNQKLTTASSLPSEVQALRRKVVEMDGKDEELVRMWDQCRDLNQRLMEETRYCRSLRAEVDKLNGRISELDRLEQALGKSRLECRMIKGSLEQEREVSKGLSGEFTTLKARVRELEAKESELKNSEAMIRQDLAKFRSLTVALVEDREKMAERLQEAEENLNGKESRGCEQSNLSDLEERIEGIVKEKDELQDRLKTEEERNIGLQNKITIMKKKLQVLENRKEKEEKYTHNSIPNNSNHCGQAEDNKVIELTRELDRLRKRLQDKEMLEGELMKAEDDLGSLGSRFKEEQRRTQTLREELEVAKRELSRYNQAEKEKVNQEHVLLCHLQKEQVKSRLLSREIDALSEKLQKLSGTEESICRVQTDHLTLQGKLAQQETKNRELAREIKELTCELDIYRKMKSLTPGASRIYSPAPNQMTKGVQTEERNVLPPDCTEHNDKVDQDCNNEDQNHNAEVIKRRGSLVDNLNSLNSANNNMSQYNSHSSNGINMHQTVNGDVMMVTHTPGQPLHIKVTPHHTLNTATLEISSPSGDAATSYTSTAVIPTSGASPKQRITIIQNSVNPKTPSSSPECTISSLNGSPIAQVLSPTSSRSTTPDHINSPIQIVTVRTCSPDSGEVANRTVLCKTPERQSSWQRSNSADTNPSIITTEDNKIHIHLGSPYIQSLNGMTHSLPQSVGPYYLRHEQRTQVVANGCHATSVGKITSSITISPDTSSASQPL